MEKIHATKDEKGAVVVELYGTTHKIQNAKNGQTVEFYGKKYELVIKQEKPKNEKN